MLKLQDYLDAPDFTGAIVELGASARKALDLPPVYQLGLVVPDADAATRRLAGNGIAPTFAVTGAPAMCYVEGVENRSTTRLVFAYHHDFELELIEPSPGAVFYARDLDPAGDIVLQHLGYNVQDLDAWVGRLCSAGERLLVRGRIIKGPLQVNYAYFDTREQHGIITELIASQLFGKYLASPRPVYSFLGRLQKRNNQDAAS